MSNGSRILTPLDVPHALELSRLAGWNQTTEDWQLAIRMNPKGCFAMEVDGMVVATTTSIRYGTDLAWIGMVLTHPEYRGRGFARTLMQQVLDHLSDVATVKLDATEMGMPLYRQLGFVDECAIERWLRPAQVTPPRKAASYIAQPALDREAFGADRGELLRQLATVEGASLHEAFAMGRGNRFGPCVSRSQEAAQRLAEWYLAKHPNELMLWDLFPENNLAKSLGFERYRTLTRMTRGRKLRGDNSLIYAGAGFEFG
jgi:hypothetical protein